MMHVDYVRESFFFWTKLKKNRKSDFEALVTLCSDDFIDHAKDLGDKEMSDLCEKMQKRQGYRFVTNEHKWITRDQQSEVMHFLFKKYGSAKLVIAKVFKIPVSEVRLKPCEISWLMRRSNN